MAMCTPPTHQAADLPVWRQSNLWLNTLMLSGRNSFFIRQRIQRRHDGLSRLRANTSNRLLIWRRRQTPPTLNRKLIAMEFEALLLGLEPRNAAVRTSNASSGPKVKQQFITTWSDQVMKTHIPHTKCSTTEEVVRNGKTSWWQVFRRTATRIVLSVVRDARRTESNCQGCARLAMAASRLANLDLKRGAT